MPVTFAGQEMTGASGSFMVIVRTHCPVLPHESAIVYVRVIILGHVPEVDSLAVKVLSTKPQLSDALPPPAKNSANVLNGGGTSSRHSPVTSAGHVMIGCSGSSTRIVWIH